MNIPQLVIRPEKRYSHGRLVRGARRTEGAFARTLALLDTLGIRKRAIRTHIALSHEGWLELQARAEKIGVIPSGLAAYLVESALREKGTS